jgi:hypothetical protein
LWLRKPNSAQSQAMGREVGRNEAAEGPAEIPPTG